MSWGAARRALFVLLAIGFACAALFHVTALFVPSLAGSSPAWRHGLFIAINGAIAALLLWRPAWFTWLFAALTLQQLYSHGRAGWEAWSAGRHDWASVLVVIAMPLVLALLVQEKRKKQGREA